MITSIDKAIAMVIMGAVFLINNFTSFHFAVDEGTVNAISAVLLPLITWLVPNKKPA